MGERYDYKRQWERVAMITGQTMFSVRHGTEHRAEVALEDIARLLRADDGVRGFRVLRSVGMSPLASDLCEEGREAALCEAHYVIQTEWESVEAHDAFYADDGLRRIYLTLSSILATGPYEILYESLIEEPACEGVTV
jgi:hypothetical protein